MVGASRCEQTDEEVRGARRASPASPSHLAPSPRHRWRLYIFKGKEVLEPLPIHRQSVYLLGRERRVADIAAEDQPLVYISKGFKDINGYQSSEAVGFNCRFLQTNASDPAAVLEMRLAIERGVCARMHVYNEGQRGGGFWSLVSLHPAFKDEPISRDAPVGPRYVAGVQQRLSGDEMINLVQTRERVLDERRVWSGRGAVAPGLA